MVAKGNWFSTSHDQPSDRAAIRNLSRISETSVKKYQANRKPLSETVVYQKGMTWLSSNLPGILRFTTQLWLSIIINEPMC